MVFPILLHCLLVFNSGNFLPLPIIQPHQSKGQSAIAPNQTNPTNPRLHDGGAHNDQELQEATGLLRQAELLQEEKKFNAAVPLMEQALALKEKALGVDHPEVAALLTKLGDIYFELVEYGKAESAHARALAINEKVLDPNHPDIALNLYKLARIYHYKSEFAMAESLYTRALAIRERAFGSDQEATLEIVIQLGEMYLALRNFARAETLFVRAVETRQRVLGPNHAKVALSFSALGDLYAVNGDPAQAETIYRKALAIYDQIPDPNVEDYASILNALAAIYLNKSDFVRAEPLFVKSLAMYEKINGPEHPNVARILSNLGVLYFSKKDYARAEPLLARSLTINEKVFGPDHVNVANSLSTLGLVYRDQPNELSRAEPLFMRALAIYEKTLGPEHPNVAFGLNNLATVYRNQNKLQKAEPLFARALAINEKILGPEHPMVATNLNNLAYLYLSLEEYAKSEPLFQRALAIYEKVLGDRHPYVAVALYNLTLVYLNRRDPEKEDDRRAFANLERCNEIVESDLKWNLASGSERQKQLYLNQGKAGLDLTVAFNIQRLPDFPPATRLALTLILRRKGRALDAMTNEIEILRKRALPEDKILLDQLTETRSTLSKLILKGPAKEGIEHQKAEINRLTAKIDQQEIEISRRNQEFQAQSEPITIESVQKAMPSDAALIEYFLYFPLGGKTQHLAAYVLTKTSEPKWADLGEVTPINQAVAEFRKAITLKRAIRILTPLEKGRPAPPPAQSIERAARNLDDLVMKPVRNLIGPATHLLVSPDGGLNLIPFAALVDESGKYLVERYCFTYLTSGRDLLRLQVKISSREPALVLADPDYATGPGPVLFGTPFSTLKRLTNTAEEGAAVKSLFPEASLRLKAEATETALKQTHKPAILHIATHGYFLEDVVEAAPEDPLEQARSGNKSKLPNDMEKLRQNNPLLRSCLFFAGANQEKSNQDDDGTLTALEATSLDLWGTKLVVLSACDTGLGDVKNGDGVYGLRRAFVLAGSESQMISLWSVSDIGTRELMVEYYTRLKAGEGRSEALRNVQLKMLKNPRRNAPYYWASFIQSGEWSNLAGDRK